MTFYSNSYLQLSFITLTTGVENKLHTYEQILDPIMEKIVFMFLIMSVNACIVLMVFVMAKGLNMFYGFIIVFFMVFNVFNDFAMPFGYGRQIDLHG